MMLKLFWGLSLSRSYFSCSYDSQLEHFYSLAAQQETLLVESSVQSMNKMSDSFMKLSKVKA